MVLRPPSVFYGLTLMLMTGMGPVFGLSPMGYYNSLVAGNAEQGFKDGKFYEAQFKQPSGLVVDDSGSRLFVADWANQRVRVVYLREENRVETLAGTGVAGNGDGAFNQASFNQPTALVWIPPNHLVVYDNGSGLLRLLDLDTKKVSTLPTTEAQGAWTLAYRPQDDSLYFTQPSRLCLRKYEMKSQKTSVLFLNQPLVPNPQALCLHEGKICVADQNLPGVYQVEAVENTASAKFTVSLDPIAKGDHILEMTSSDHHLYAIQAGADPLVCLLPDYQPLYLPTPWGFLTDEKESGSFPFFTFSPGRRTGLAASPAEPRRLFMLSSGSSSIFSVKDYGFQKFWWARSRTQQNQDPTDFDYPPLKPPQTFRILVVGDSRVVTAPAAGPLTAANGFNLESGEQSLNINLFSKRLEFLLNSEAALQGVPTHYEVLTSGHPGWSTPFWANAYAPALVHKYDVDLVFVFLTHPNGYEGYFSNPLDAQGMPSSQVDAEYLLKPWKDKIPPGLPSQFYQDCKQAGLVRPGTPTALTFASFGSLFQNAEVRKDLLGLIGRPLKALEDKLKSLRTTGGAAPKMIVGFAPTADLDGAQNSDYEFFWKDLGTENQLNFMDLTAPFEVLGKSYYPVDQACCHYHYTAYGNELIAVILKHNLIEQKWIPWSPALPDPATSK